MKPRNKFQKQVAELAIQLPTITDKQSQWAYTHLFNILPSATRKANTLVWSVDTNGRTHGIKARPPFAPIAERNSPYIQNGRGYLRILHTIAYSPPSKATK